MVNAEQRIDMVRKNIRCVCVLYTIYNKNTMQLNRRERQYHIKKKKKKKCLSQIKKYTYD